MSTSRNNLAWLLGWLCQAGLPASAYAAAPRAEALQQPAALSTGDAILRDVDAQLRKTHSQILTLDMTIQDPGHTPRRIGLQMHMRGEQRRVAFLYPGDMKGMRVLNLSPEQTYVYLPSFHRVRRIASHLREQTFFGSDYTFDDFSNILLHANYNGTVSSEDDEAWIVQAIPKQKRDNGFSRLQLRINKKIHAVEELRYFGANDKLARTEVRSDFQCSDSGCAPYKTKMIDHRRDNHWTEVQIKEMQLNVPFPEQIFSVRALQPND